MAAATISIDQDQFCCPVCLEILRDPATIPCGHSYCLDCITDYWSRPKQKDSYSCPQCRQVFNPKPLLSRNTVLGEVVEKFLTSERVQAAADLKEVKCSNCRLRSSRAVKSCLVCLESYCLAHLKVHEEHFQRKAHQLIPASDHLRENLCQQHDKLLRLYCLTDHQCVCSQCVKEKHRGHETVSVGEERTSQQKRLKESSITSLQRLRETEKELRYAIRFIKHCTEAAVEESERTFSKLIRSIEKQSSEVEELIRIQEKAAVAQAQEGLEKIQKEIAELKRTEAELEKLSHTENSIFFLQKCKSLYIPTKTAEMPDTDAVTYSMYKTIGGALVDLRENLNDMIKKDFIKLSKKVIPLKDSSNASVPEKTKVIAVKDGSSASIPEKTKVIPVKEGSKASVTEKTKATREVEISFDVEPKSRADFLQYYNDIALDPNTSNSYLSFSDGGRCVTTGSELQLYADHPDRFTNWAQVLCRAGMAGRCYWEVEWAGSGGVSIGVCYRNMSRRGEASDCKLGHNSRSWSLDCSDTACSFQHNSESVVIAAACGSRIGVYLDFRAGTLAFYNVSDKMVLIYKEQTTFTQPLYPGFWVGLGSTLKLC